MLPAPALSVESLRAVLATIVEHSYIDHAFSISQSDYKRRCFALLAWPAAGAI
jgi:hypothetical protein